MCVCVCARVCVCVRACACVRERERKEERETEREWCVCREMNEETCAFNQMCVCLYVHS